VGTLLLSHGSITLRISSRCFLFFLLAMSAPLNVATQAAPSASTTGQRQLLDEAFQAFLDHQGRWAYTEAFYWFGYDEKKGPETAFRFDPSLPYAKQRTLLKQVGNPPTAEALEDWNKHYEKDTRRREAALEKESEPAAAREDFQIQLYNEKVTPLISDASVIAETETNVTYEIPLRKAGGAGQPLYKKHRLTARVSKASHQFEFAEFRQLEPQRAAAARYYDGVISIEFGLPDARFPAAPVKVTTEVTEKPLFTKAVRSRNVKLRSDFKHVTPYDERFGVRIGPLRTIEF
jgi:hypothetical protein